MQRLERDRRAEISELKATEFDVFGFVDDSHTAAAELLDDPVVRDGLTDHLDCEGTPK